MRITHSIVKTFAFLLIFSFHNFEIKAGIIKESNFIQGVPGALVQLGSPDAFKTVELNPLSGGVSFTDFNIKDYLSLSVPLDQYHYTEPFALKAKVKVFPYNEFNVLQNGFIEIVTLSINYNPYTGVTTFNDAETKLFGWHYPKYEMLLFNLELSTNGGAFVNVTELPPYVMIEGEIEANRIYNFASLDPSFNFNAPPSGIDLNCDASSTPDEIELTWDPQDEAESYDVEWTYVNNYGLTLGSPLGNTVTYYNFSNCTRINTSLNSYRVTNIYDKGFLVFRIRAVGRDINNPDTYVYGEWSVPSLTGTVFSAGGNNYFHVVDDHEEGINWQVSTTFAEEGKKKEVVSYFDGSYKNRETVTKANTDNNAVVGQTIYDSYGRAAINVLPVPVVSGNNCTDPLADQTNPIQFYPKFNQNLNGDQYSAADFDYNGTICPPLTPPAAPMKTSSGASQYYSPDNLRLTSFRDLLPDALKYPFGQVEFTPDNTGRVRRQGSVGPDFQLNGKSSLYLYGQPNQLQLDRLFGPEAGDATHYKKSLVIDPNGQASVSYVNMQGKTVATSLTGKKPDNMEWLFPTVPAFSDLTVDLLNKDVTGHSELNIPNANQDAIEFNTTILVPDQEDYTFDYSVSVGTFNDDCMFDNICFDCVYDLEIKVIDECGVNRAANIFGNGAPSTAVVGAGVTYDELSHTYSLNMNTSCVDNPNDGIIYNLIPSFVLFLEPGTYSVTKTLKINTAARDYYLQQYLTEAVNDCYEPIGHYQSIANADVTLDDCHVTCAECAAALGDRDLFVSSGQGTAEQYDMMLEECNAPCTPVDECKVFYLQMLADVSIGGQYAEYLDASNGTINPGIFPVSILNESNSLRQNNFDWRHPEVRDLINYSLIASHYLEDDGSEAHVNLFQVASNGNVNDYDPVPVSLGDVHYDNINNVYWTYPEKLANVSDFVAKWHPSWAKALLSYHPEFCLYSLCKSYDNIPQGYDISSTDFDDKLVVAAELPDAVAAGLISAGGVVNFSTDPFLNSVIYGNYALSLNYKLNNYQVSNGTMLSMLQFATYISKCGTQYGAGVSGPTDPCIDFTSALPSEQGEIWVTFKNLYLSEKRKLKFKRYKDLFASSCMYNDCIGNDQFNWWTAGMWTSPWWSSPVLNPGSQPCAWATYHNYTHKARRFVGPNDAMALGNQDDVDLQMYYTTGQCPMAFHLQSLLTGLVSADQLDELNIDLQTVDAFSPKLYEVLNSTLNPPYNNYTWNATASGNILNIEFKDQNGNVVCEMMLDKTDFPSTVDWDDISGISHLMANGVVGTHHNFTASADYITVNQNNETVIAQYDLTGYSTCFDIDGCTFPQECDLNDFGSDMYSLLNAIAINNGSLIHTPFALNTGYAPFLTTQIANVLGVTTAATFNYECVAGATIDIKIWANAITNKYIHLVVDNFDPSSFTAFSTINSLGDFKPEYQNDFEFDGLDNMQNVIVHASGTATFYNNGGITMLPLGKCQVPTPLACQTTEHQLKEDLETLLTSIEWDSYSSNWTTLDLSTSSNFTYLLDDFLPLASPAGNNEEEGGVNSDTLNLNFGDCGFELFGDTAIGGIPIHDITNLTDIIPPLVLVGIPDENGNQFAFYASAMYGVGNPGFVYGVTCLPLKSCDPCPWQNDTLPIGGGQSRITGENILSPNNESSKSLIAYDNESFESLIRGFNRFFPDLNDKRRLNPDLFDNDKTFKGSVSEAELDGYIKYIQNCALRNANLTSAPLNVLKWIESKKTLSSPKGSNIQTLKSHNFENADLYKISASQECIDAYDKYLLYIGYYNATPAGIANPLMNLFVDADDFTNKGYCKCSDAYVADLIKTIDNNLVGVAIDKFEGCPEKCELMFLQYTIAIDNYNSSVYGQTYPLATNYYQTFQDFYDEGMCSCAREYILYLSGYTSGQTTSPLALDLNDWVKAENCRAISEANCQDNYEKYKNAIETYNTLSVWAINHGNHQIVGGNFNGPGDFYNSGYCDCVIEYLNYLLPYIQNVASNSAPLPVDITQWEGCGQGVNINPCKQNYLEYLQAISDYNGSAAAQQYGTIADPFNGDYNAFYEAGYCSCVRLYINMLQAYTNGSMPVGSDKPATITSWKDCEPYIGDFCKNYYEQFKVALYNYNNGYAIPNGLAPLLDPFGSSEAMYDQGFCYCVLAYIEYLSSFNNNTSAVIPGSAIAAIPIINWEGCGIHEISVCEQNYIDYLQAVNDYNNSPSAQIYGTLASPLFSTYEDFYKRGYCSCVRMYILMLEAYTLGSMPSGSQPPSSIVDWKDCEPFIGDICNERYQLFLAAIQQYNVNYATPNGLPVLTDPFGSPEAFYNQGYCYCTPAYIEYLLSFGGVSTIIMPPIGNLNVATPINQWEGCGNVAGDTCRTNYLNYIAAINAFNNSAYIIANPSAWLDPNLFGGYHDFYKGGYCSCVRLYISLLQTYINGSQPISAPPPPAINLWAEHREGCTPIEVESCEEIFKKYKDVIIDYNTWAQANGHPLLTNPFSSTDQFYNQGYCYCADAYFQYLLNDFINHPLPVLGNAVPIWQWEGCIIIDPSPCVTLYNNYVNAINLYNGSGFSTAHNHDLPIISQAVFIASNYCNCVEGYITYLSNFTSGNVDPVGDNPVTINNWEGCNEQDDCIDLFSDYNATVSAYNAYATIANGYPEIINPISYTYNEFVDQGLCDCAEGYVAYLNAAINGLITAGHFNSNNLYIAEYCDEIQPEVLCDSVFPYQVDSTDTIMPSDPCAYQMQMNANLNATILYNEQLVLLTSQFIERYNAHCMGAVENFTEMYADREYQFTLYYYDQQDNLIKTVPPEGVEILSDDLGVPITSYLDPVEQKVIADRTNNTQTVFTEHRLASVYEYNSLNQLVRQSLPDHDKMEICEYTLPNGLDNRLVTTSTHFIDGSKGYLTGYINSVGNKGLLYVTYDAGVTWNLVNDLLGAGVNKIQMYNSNFGYAVCESGLFLRTLDGGNTWDIMNTYGKNRTVSLNDIVITGTGGTGIIVGDNGLIIGFSGFGATLSAPVISANWPTYSATKQLKSITSSGGTFYIVGQNDVSLTEHTGLILRSTDGISWTEIPASAYNNSDQNKVRYLDNLTAVSVGDDGNMMITSNSGTDWKDINTGIYYDLNDVVLKSSNEGIAIVTNPLNGNKKEIWRGDFTTSPATWATLSNPAHSFNGLFPYDISATAKAVAVGDNGRVERVIMGAFPYGMINISPAGASTINFTTASTFLYPTNKLFVAVAGNSNTIYYTLNGNQSVPVWQSVTLTGFTLAGGEYIKSIVLQPFTNTSVLAGVVLLSNGKLYDIRATGWPTPLVFSVCTPYTSPVNTSQSFADLAIVPSLLPNTISQTKDIYAFNNNALSNGLHFITINNNNTPTTSTTAIVASPVNYLAMNARSVNVSPNGNNRAVLVGGSYTTSGKGGLVLYGNQTYGVATITNNNTTLTPLPLNDVSAKGAADLFVTGTNGTMMYSSDGVTFKAIENKLTSTITSINYYSNGTSYIYGTEGGEVFKTTALGYSSSNTLTTGSAISTVATAINDIKSDLTNVAIVGQGTVLTSPDGGTTIASVVGSYSYLNFKGAAFIPGTTDLYAGSTDGKLIKYGSGYAAKINAIRPGILNDVHFDNSNNGYVVGANGFYRYTNSGSTNWSVVLPVIDAGTNVVYTANTVYMTNPTTAIVAGDKTFIAKYNGTTQVFNYYDDAYNAKFKDISFKGNDGIVIGQHTGLNSDIAYYKTRDNGINWYGATSTLYNFSNAANSGLPGLFDHATPVDANSVHVFNSRKFICVGADQSIVYGDIAASTNLINPNKNGLTIAGLAANAKLNAVTFVDDLWGYIGGDNGVFLKTTGVNKADESLSYNAVQWGAANCSLSTNSGTGCNIASASDINVSVVRFSSRFDGFIAGKTVAISCSSTPKYAVLLHDESNLFSSRFWYDKLGRLVLSQNSKQHKYPVKAVSYTRYDELGRIAEVGEKYENSLSTEPKFASIFGSLVGTTFNPKAIDDANLEAWITATGARKDVTSTYYDRPNIIVDALTFLQDEETMRKRVASATYERIFDNDPLTYDHASHYNYDIHGNVTSLLQDNKKNPVTTERYKRLDYDFDLVSGKVNKVTYQANQPDQYIHVYEYDGDNRITSVSTSKDGMHWDNDATYKYYEHGPLARVEMGSNHVQGVDYAYTLQGWIKGVNSNTLSAENDMGKDGLCFSGSANPNEAFARDAYGNSLGYFNNDYKPIGGSNVSFEASLTASALLNDRKELFNGNIASTVNTITPAEVWTFGTASSPHPLALGSVYVYDQLNRIRNSHSFDNLDLGNNLWPTTVPSNTIYGSTYTYDANGNILTLDRYDETGSLHFDQLQYGYHTESGKLIRNRLYHVDDAGTNLNTGEDITDDVSTFETNPLLVTTANNYGYDAIGNLERDTKEEIQNIEWNVAGKISKITRTATSTKTNLEFDYDATGQRIAKHEYTNPSNNWLKSTYYSRDPQGNVMAVYEHKNASPNAEYVLAERHIYGSSRIGMDVASVDMIATTGLSDQNQHLLGYKQYELSNHLGNVQAVVSDFKIPVDVEDLDTGIDGINELCPSNSSSPDGVADHYLADVRNTYDYYPFGMMMSARSYRLVYLKGPNFGTDPTDVILQGVNATQDPATIASEFGGYRYGYGNQEKDDEISGAGNKYTALFWEYDVRLGRRWNIDPVSDPSQSSYSAFNNNPIAFNDPNGDCADCPDKPKQSEYLSTFGIDLGSFGNGVADGFIGALPDLAGFAWDMLTDEATQDQFVDGMKTLISDPLGAIKAFAADKYDLYSSVLSGNGTEQQKYDVGKELGGLLFGIATGAAATKLTEVIKIAKAESKLLKAVEAADKATGSGSPQTRGVAIHKKVEEVYGKKGKGEVPYVKGKKVDGYRPKGSSNPDVRYSAKPNKPKIVYDVKTGKSGMSTKQLNQYKSNLPKGTKIKEVIKNDKGKYVVKTVGKS